MRRIWLVALLLLAVGADAQDFIRYAPPPGTFSSGVTGTTAFFTGPVSIGNTAAAPYANLYGDAANTLALRNGGTDAVPVEQKLNIYNFCAGAACATGYEMARVGWNGDIFEIRTLYAGTGSAKDILINSNNSVVQLGNSIAVDNDGRTFGAVNFAWQSVAVARTIHGSKSTALADDTKKAFATVPIAAGSYGGGDILYTLYCADANDRVSRSGRIPWAGQNTGGTETCAVGTATSSGDVTNNAKAFTSATFTCADGGANAVQIEVQADCTIAAPTVLTIEWRFDNTKIALVAPAT